MVEHLGLAHQVLLSTVDLHGIAQCATRTRHNGDLLHRRGMGLHGCHHGMSELMIGDDALLLRRDDGTLLLFTGNDRLHTLLDVIGLDLALTKSHGTQSSLVDDVGDVGATGSGSSATDYIQVDIAVFYLLQMYLEDCLTSFQIRQLHDNAAIETSGTQQCLVQALRPVGGGKDHHAFGGIETVHLSEQLVERLLTLIIAHGLVTALADGIDLVDEDDTRCLLCSLTEQITHLGSTHTDEHLYKLGTGNREEWHVSLTGHSTRDQRLACSRRANEQCTFGQTGTQSRVFPRIVEEVDEFLERRLGLVLPGDIGEARLYVTLGIDFRTGVSQREEASAGTFHHLTGSRTPDPIEDQTRQDPPKEEVNNGRILLWQLLSKDDVPTFGRTLRLEQPVYQLGIVDLGGTEILLAFLSCHLIIDATLLDVDARDRSFVHSCDKGVVVSILHGLVTDVGEKQTVEKNQDQQSHKNTTPTDIGLGFVVIVQLTLLHGITNFVSTPPSAKYMPNRQLAFFKALLFQSRLHDLSPISNDLVGTRKVEETKGVHRYVSKDVGRCQPLSHHRIVLYRQAGYPHSHSDIIARQS